MGNFSATVGEERCEDIFGPLLLGIRNDTGEQIIEWAKPHDLAAGNTLFQQHPRTL